MVEAWQPGGFMRLWWDALSEQEQLDYMQGARDARDAWWAALSEQEQLDHALRCKLQPRPQHTSWGCKKHQGGTPGQLDTNRINLLI